MDDNTMRENNLTTASGSVTTTSSSTVSKKLDMDDIPDYNEAFPQLTSAGNVDIVRSSTFFTSPFSASANNSKGAMANTTASYPTAQTDEERRRLMAIHASSTTTKIIEILPEDRAPDASRRGGNQSSRNASANSNGQSIQKLCIRIQKETSTNISHLYKDQKLFLTITGRPEQVRAAQVQILREIQKTVLSSVNIPLDFHRFIIGPRGATLKQLEQETSTRITVPPQDSQSNAIQISGAKDNVKLCEHRILELYQAQLNKGFERLSIPCLYHPWIRNLLVDDLHRQLNVTIDLPPPVKQTDEIIIRGEREPVEQAKAKVMQLYESLNGKIMTLPLEIPCEQHRFILGKKGAGLKDIFDKTNVIVRIPNQEQHSTTIQVIGEAAKIGDAITMIYKMANSLTAIQIDAPRWMQSVAKGERSNEIENLRKTYPNVRIIFRDDHIAIEGPPEEVEHVRNPIEAIVNQYRAKYTAYAEVEIDPQYYKQLIGKNQARLHEIEEQSGCDIKFPYEDDRLVKLMGTKETVEKAKQILNERVKKLANELTTNVTIDPQYYPQLIGTKGKNLEEVRSKFHNIQITFPDANGKSDKVKLHGDKEDVEKCSKFLQQKFKDLHSVEIEVPKRLYPMLIGKGGANIQRIREKVPDVRIDIPSLDDNKDATHIRLNGKKADVDKARKVLEEHIDQLNTSIENSIEECVTIDPKWHSRFFQNRRKLLNDLQQQYGEMLIKLPDRNANSDQVILRGPKEVLEQVRKRLEELVDTWENTVTKETIIPHRHHGYLLAQGGVHIQPIQKQYNVQIKFPPRSGGQKDEQESAPTNDDDEKQKDTVRVIGRSADVDQAMIALEKLIPVESSVDIPYEAHGMLVGKSGANLQLLIKKYPDVQVKFPPADSAQNTIKLRGQSEQVEGIKKELVESYEKYQADKQARSHEVRFTIKPYYRSLLFGPRGKTINSLQKKHEVKIDVLNSQLPVPSSSTTTDTNENNEEQHDEQQTTSSQENTETTNQSVDLDVVITGYEDKTIACRDEILQLIKDFEAKITMEIDIDPRIHARIIGWGGQKLQQIMKDYNVEIKFQANHKTEKVHVTGLDQDKIDACIEHLLFLEEDFLQDLPYRPSTTTLAQSQNDSTSNQHSAYNQHQDSSNVNNNKSSNENKKQQRQASFQVKNAPWTNGKEHSNDYQHDDHKRQRNGHENSSKKSTPSAPNRDDLGEYPLFSNGLPLPTDDNSSQVHQTTVNTVPVIWGPPKRNK